MDRIIGMHGKEEPKQQEQYEQNVVQAIKLEMLDGVPPRCSL